MSKELKKIIINSYLFTLFGAYILFFIWAMGPALMGSDIAVIGGVVFYIIYLVPILIFTFRIFKEPKNNKIFIFYLVGIYAILIFNTIQFINCFLPYSIFDYQIIWK